MGLKDLGYKPRRSSKRIILDDTLRAEYEEAHAALQRELKRPDRGLESGAEERLAAAEAAADKAAVSFVCEAVPRHVMAELIADYPPTPDQLAEWKQQDQNNPLLVIDPPAWDLDKVTPRLIAASLVEPETTVDEVVEMWDNGEWSHAIWSELWKLAWDETNRRVSTLPTFGIDSAKTPVSDPKSPTQ